MKIYFNLHHHLNKNDEKNIMLIISNKGKRKHINTSISINERYWNDEKNYVRKTHPDFQNIDNQLNILKNKYQIIENQGIKDKNENQSLIFFIQSFIEKIQIDKKFGSAKKYISIINHLIEYERVKNVKLSINDIRIEFLEDFESYLKVKGTTANTYKSYFEKIQMIRKRLIMLKKISNIDNPFEFFKVKGLTTSKSISLEEWEINKIFIWPLDVYNENLGKTDVQAVKYLAFVRALLMFRVQFLLQGIRIGDMLCLKWGNIIVHYNTQMNENSLHSEDLDVEFHLKYIMNKTKKEMKIKLSGDMLFRLRFFLSGYVRDKYLTKYLKNDKEYYQIAMEQDKRKYLSDENFNWLKNKELVENFKNFILINLEKMKDDYIFINNKICKSLNDKELYDRIGNERAKYNKGLIKVKQNLLLNNHLSSHISRHSYAVSLLNQTDDIYSVSKSLGHSNTIITERYLKRLNEKKLDDINKKIASKYE